MRLHNGRTTLFRHINGMDGQFILLENHPSWMPVNDGDFNHAAPLPDGLAVHEESFYPFEKIDVESADNIKIFSEEALRLEKERLNAIALVELAKNLKAAQAEADLAALLEKMDFHLKQDDIFK
ncbi:hypothetical protein [Neisseria sp. HMSC068C04]|uniref:hypothetical protein n=1 Tax=Neisseria sp. HMSC068C04 TaxID=1715179 RepID=UPI0008A5F04E|nr:hypothetical protein [Neisseria sp. HMSC068C04]OFM31731.1 hypothetical protein HMPREF2700_02115 [Neisseria sp. HMSC068C04]